MTDQDVIREISALLTQIDENSRQIKNKINKHRPFDPKTASALKNEMSGMKYHCRRCIEWAQEVVKNG